MSQASAGSMNVSHQGYGSDAGKNLQQNNYPEHIMTNKEPTGRISNSSIGIEDLQGWLK